MGLNKYSHQSDAVVDLYRAALYLARGATDVGLSFLVKAKKTLGDQLDPQISSLVGNQKKYFKNTKNSLFWAGKILDEYQKLKHTGG